MITVALILSDTQIKHLEKLKLSDSGSLQSLNFIKSLPKLKFISFVGTNVRDERIDASKTGLKGGNATAYQVGQKLGDAAAVYTGVLENAENQKKGPKDLVEEAKALQEKRAKAEERQTKRDNATREGQNKTGQSNQDTRGSHASGKSKAKENTHQAADARRAREQKAADEKQQKKKNN